MTQKEKELLIKELCARLPFGIKCQFVRSTTNTIYSHTYDDILTLNNLFKVFKNDYIVRPYLRPMSSMTEEERRELSENVANGVFEISKGGVEIWSKEYSINNGTIVNPYMRPSNVRMLVSSTSCYRLIDWLNSHYFDYRGLIKKGLALEAPKGMYENNN